MKPRNALADASTLIYLAKADALPIAARCVGPLLIPPAVWKECVEAGERKGALDVARIRLAEHEGLVRPVELPARALARAREIAERHMLGTGESELLAMARAGQMVLLDEGRATRVAVSFGLSPISTLLVPVIGAFHGRLAVAEAKTLVRRLAVVSGARADLVLQLEAILGRTKR